MSTPTAQPESARDAFARLLGLGTDQKLADAEIQALMAIKEKLKLDGTDAMWQVLEALHYYDRLYRTYPGLIKDSAIATLEQFRRAASAEAEKAKTTVQKSLTDAVTAASKDIAVNTSRKELLRWIVVGLVIGAAIVFGAYYYGNREGRDTGYALAKAEVTDQKAAASWANTDEGKQAKALAATPGVQWLASAEGQRAYRFYRRGELQAVMNCAHPGWEKSPGSEGKSQWCVAQADQNGQVFWRLE